MSFTPDQALRSAMQLHQAGKSAEAEATYRQVLRFSPNQSEALHYLGLLAFQGGRKDEGLELMGRAVQAEPHAAQYWANFAHALKLHGDWDAAIDAWRKAAALRPGFAPAHAELAGLLQSRGRLSEALDQAQIAVQLQPDDAALHGLLGTCLLSLQRDAEAVAALERAIELLPAYFEAHSNLGAALHAGGHFSQAEEAFRRAIALSPQSSEAHANLGLSLHMQGRVEEGGDAFRKAVALDPGSADTHARLLYTLHHDPRQEPRQIFREHRNWADRHAAPLAPRHTHHANDADPVRRLRVGYVSIDFRRHSVAYFLEPILAARDRAMFEVFCYADVPVPDDATERLQRHADAWRDIGGKSDAEIAQIVANDKIDILVDLVGHTASRLLRVFARRPAPIQISYLGYPGTTGLSGIDYRLTDALADPPGLSERHHTEKLVRLPDAAWCYRPPAEAPAVAETPCLCNGFVTFGSFNMLPKITPSTIRLWAQILKKTPNSRMVVKARSFSDPPSRDRIARLFAGEGIDLSRVDLRSRTEAQAHHLADYGTIDIELDTYPYNGTTIICESLWMGVPVVSLAGASHVSRVGLSLLTNAGLSELVAKSSDQYVQIATTLAADPRKLGDSRRTLRQSLLKSPLLNERQFAANLERIYRMTWQAWCSRAPS